MWDSIERMKFRLGSGTRSCRYGLVLGGGGARASYQAGVLQFMADALPHVDLSIITGVSAGSLNAAYISNDLRGFQAAAHNLVNTWEKLTSDDVYESTSGFQLFWNVLRKTGAEESGELIPRYGLVHTDPLHSFLTKSLGAADGILTGIRKNIQDGVLDACAFITTNYATGQTVAWTDGRNLENWDRSDRVSYKEELTVDHIMASSSLPFLFPAIQLGDTWYGDGGIRMADPLSPAVHLGADRILAISTRYGRSRSEADEPLVQGYPPAAQIFGLLLNAIFLDRLDQDAALLERMNELLRSVPSRKRQGMRPIDLLVLRPSVDLGKLSRQFEADLGGILKLIGKGLGSKDTKSPDWLSMILFEPEYATRLIEIGYEDAKQAQESLVRFFDPSRVWGKNESHN
ncbi:MAG: patatin-like phospholipase family protein [Rhodothermia bacterium]|nr:MAG: patatin-like phospholipase family protein [Rhodothermia bacterium]